MAPPCQPRSAEPVFSVLFPAFNTPERFLREAIDSVRAQSYPHWELCIADDASTAPHVRRTLEEYAAADDRIQLRFRAENGHISRASNSALELATGEFVALLDHDDVLPRDALAEVALVLEKHPDADLVYSDEDKIDGAGRRFDPFFKPQWSPESLLSRNYVCHLGVYRRTLVEQLGGFREGFEGAQDYDLVLRFTEATDRIHHIPKILYHWRFHSASAAAGAAAKPYAYRAGRRAVADALKRRGEPGRVDTMRGFPGLYHARLDVTSTQSTSLVVTTSNAAALDRSLGALAAYTDLATCEVLIVCRDDNAEVGGLAKRWSTLLPGGLQVVGSDSNTGLAASLNRAAARASGRYLVFLDAAVEPQSSGWLVGMMEQAQRPAIGAVGPLLLDRRGVIRHAGIILGVNGLYGYAMRQSRYPCTNQANYALCMNNVAAVSGSCLTCRKEAFDAVGGFDERYASQCHDVDLCLKLLAAGCRNVYLPFVRMIARSPLPMPRRVRQPADPADDAALLRSRWPAMIQDDPHYSPHLTRRHEDFGLRLEAAGRT